MYFHPIFSTMLNGSSWINSRFLVDCPVWNIGYPCKLQNNITIFATRITKLYFIGFYTPQKPY